MSDTPKLLALMSASRDLNAIDYSKQLEVLVRELERENAELRERLEQAATDEGKLRRENTRLLEAALNAPKAVGENAALADENRRLHVELDAHHNGEQLRVLRAENAALRAELLEEARVNGKGSEREATLLAEVAALRKAKEMLEVERCECLRTMDLALNESAGLRGALEELQAMRLEDVGDLCDEVLQKKVQP